MLVIHEQVTCQRRPLVLSARFTRILIVDDNVLNRKIARHMLEQLGYQASCIFTASNGVEAIACIASKMFDVIILDNQMPVMGGEETARRIRLRWPAHTDRPYIIGATASATEQARQMCLDSGMIKRALSFMDLCYIYSGMFLCMCNLYLIYSRIKRAFI